MNVADMLNRCTSDGWLTLPEAELLVDTARRTTGPIVEVGTYCGRSAMLLAQLGRPLVCIDPFEGFHSEKSGSEIYKRLWENLGSIGNADVHVIPSRVEDVRGPWSFSFDFAHLDGDHSYEGTKRQIQFALDRGAKDICIHDVNDDGEGEAVKRAAVEMLGAWDDRAERMAAWYNLQ